MKRLYPALVAPFAVLVIIAATARAQSPAQPALAESAIREFYRENTDSMHRSYPEYLAYLKKSLAADYHGRAAMKIKFANRPAISISETQTRQTLLDHARHNYESMKGATCTENILRIEVAADGRSAAVTTRAAIRGQSVPDQGGRELIADSRGDCRDEVILSARDGIQVRKSECAIETTVTEGQSL